MRRSALWTLLVTLGVTLLGTGSTASAHTANENCFTTTYDNSGIAVNPCSGEVIAVTGYCDQNICFVVTPSGRVHSSFHEVCLDSGVGDHGNSYVVRSSIAAVSNEIGNGATEFLFVSRARYTSQGTAPNFEVVCYRHVTVNANGAIVDNRDLGCTTECKGSE